jgi:hypothetical protein
MYEDFFNTHLMMNMTQSLSLSMNKQRAAAGGYSIADAHAEWTDNSFDAEAITIHTAIIPLPSGETSVLVYDTGHGATELPPFYGTGSAIYRKKAGNRGLYNHGHMAAIGRFAPDRATHVSRALTNQRASTLIFDVAKLFAAIDATPPESSEILEWRHIDETVLPAVFRSTQNSGLTEEIRDTLTELRAAIAGNPNYANADTFLAGVLANTIPSYHAMELRYAIFPSGMLADIKDAIMSYRLTYKNALSEGHSIELMAPEEKDCIHIKAEHAIDPLGTPSTQRLRANMQVRHNGDTTVVEFQPYIFTDGATPFDMKRYWFAHKEGGKITFKGQTKYLPSANFYVTEPPGWSTMQIGGNMKFACSILSGEEDRKQKSEVGSSIFNTLESMRGGFLRLKDRYLGLPVYNTKDWPNKRNVGALRFEIYTEDASVAQRYMGIQTRKSCVMYDGLAHAIQMLLGWVIARVIIPNYHIKMDIDTKGDSPGVTDWNFPRFCRLIVNTSAVEAESDTDTDSSSSSGSTAPPPVALPFEPLAETSVGSHKRSQAMSPHQAMDSLAKLVERLHSSNLASIVPTASTTTQAGLSTLHKEFLQYLTKLESYGLEY